MNAPSPHMATTGRSGQATLAPIAVGKLKPIVSVLLYKKRWRPAEWMIFSRNLKVCPLTNGGTYCTCMFDLEEFLTYVNIEMLEKNGKAKLLEIQLGKNVISLHDLPIKMKIQSMHNVFKKFNLFGIIYKL